MKILQKMICDADNAIYNKEYDSAYCLCVDIANHEGATVQMKRLARRAKGFLDVGKHQLAWDRVHELYDLTQPEEDKIRPTTKE